MHGWDSVFSKLTGTCPLEFCLIIFLFFLTHPLIDISKDTLRHRQEEQGNESTTLWPMVKKLYVHCHIRHVLENKIYIFIELPKHTDKVKGFDVLASNFNVFFCFVLFYSKNSLSKLVWCSFCKGCFRRNRKCFLKKSIFFSYW